MKPTVIASILEREAEVAAARLEAVPERCGLVEIRADRLRPDDVAGLVRRAGRPVLVSVRRPEDGGRFDGSEEERRAILTASLEAGARFADVEWNGPLAELADGETAERVILSHHGAACRAADLRQLYRAMASTRARLLKIVPRAERADEAGAVRGLLDLARSDGRDLACFSMGRAGLATRVLAASWGSWGSYGAAAPGRETAEGQLTVEDLLDLFRVLEIGPSTRRFALVGNAVSTSPSPAMHHACYREMRLDACYLAVEAERFDEVEGAADALQLEGLAVTIPFKEAAAKRCRGGDEPARRAGSVNTVVMRSGEWKGYSTDGPAALGLIRAHLDPRGARVAVVGAGGTARALAAVLAQGGAAVTVFNRNVERARRLGSALGVAAGSLEDLASAEWDILVQTTPLGRHGETVMEPERLNGRVILDAVYGSRPTPLVREARRRGLVAIDGFDLLVAQAVLQFSRLTGREPSPATMQAAGRRWLAAHAP